MVTNTHSVRACAVTGCFLVAGDLRGRRVQADAARAAPVLREQGGTELQTQRPGRCPGVIERTGFCRHKEVSAVTDPQSVSYTHAGCRSCFPRELHDEAAGRVVHLEYDANPAGAVRHSQAT
jgi:hypothetical protein